MNCYALRAEGAGEDWRRLEGTGKPGKAEADLGYQNKRKGKEEKKGTY